MKQRQGDNGCPWCEYLQVKDELLSQRSVSLEVGRRHGGCQYIYFG
jgi:hypothetical protein